MFFITTLGNLSIKLFLITHPPLTPYQGSDGGQGTPQTPRLKSRPRSQIPRFAPDFDVKTLLESGPVTADLTIYSSKLLINDVKRNPITLIKLSE